MPPYSRLVAVYWILDSSSSEMPPESHCRCASSSSRLTRPGSRYCRSVSWRMSSATRMTSLIGRKGSLGSSVSRPMSARRRRISQAHEVVGGHRADQPELDHAVPVAGQPLHRLLQVLDSGCVHEQRRVHRVEFMSWRAHHASHDESLHGVAESARVFLALDGDRVADDLAELHAQ